MVAPSASSPKSIRSKFSLATMFLLLTTLVCAVGWIAALRKAGMAEQKTLELRRQVDALRDELGIIDVVDNTKVHVVGLSVEGEWKLYFPAGEYAAHTFIGDHAGELNGPYPSMLGSKPMKLAGERTCKAKLLFDEATKRYGVKVVAPGLESATQLDWENIPDASKVQKGGVAPGERRVYEPGEPIILFVRRAPMIDSDGNRKTFAFWLEPKVGES